MFPSISKFSACHVSFQPLSIFFSQAPPLPKFLLIVKISLLPQPMALEDSRLQQLRVRREREGGVEGGGDGRGGMREERNEGGEEGVKGGRG